MRASTLFAMSLCALTQLSCDDSSESMTADDYYAKAQDILRAKELSSADYTEATRLLHQAAEAGYLKAETDLAGIYLEGGKVAQKDVIAAYHWFSKAAAQGHVGSALFLGDLLYVGAPGLEQNKPRAREYWMAAAEAGLAEAKFRLGRDYIDQGGRVEEGMALLRESAAAGYHRASCHLGFVLMRGAAGIEPDAARAVQAYESAAEMGNKKALYICSLLAFDGELVPKDEAKAIRYLRLSAGQDELLAMRLLITLLRKSKQPALLQEAEAWNKRLIKLQDKASSRTRALGFV